MIPPDLSNIRRIRKELGLSQKELARLSNTSQSLIARIESGTFDPGYKKVTQIFKTLNKQKEKGVTAEEIMNKPIISVERNNKIGGITKIMIKKGVSQMPVFDKSEVVGSVSEEIINEAISKDKNLHDFYNTEVGEIMGETFSIVPPETQINVISVLLETNKAALVVGKGKPIGIITKTDFLKAIKE